MRKAMVLGALTLAGSLASPAFADDFKGFRLGVLLSQDNLKGHYSHSIVSPPEVSATTASDSDRLGYELFGGWALNKYLAVEVGLRNGAPFSKSVYPAFAASLDTAAATQGSEFYILRQDLLSVQSSVVGSLWIGNKFSVYGRAGFMAWRGEVRYSYGDIEPPVTTPATPPYKFVGRANDNGFAPLGGIGIQTQLDHALVRFEYQYADIGDVAFGPNFGSTDNEFDSLAFSIVWTL